MTFLQPWVLAALPLVAIPVIIHLLNRVRHRTQPWAAMRFLLAASRQQRGRRRLRHFLVLLCRMLAVAALVLMLGRPLTGGWLGRVGGGAPEVVVVLLDRSASMELRVGGSRQGKRARALEQLAQAAAQSGAGRLVLVDSASLVPREIAAPEDLPEHLQAAPSDTAADVPALLEAGLAFVRETAAGRAEFWLASDLRTADWRPGSSAWEAARAGFAAAPSPVPVRLLALPGEAPSNLSVAVEGARRVPAAGAGAGDDLVLDLRVSRTGTGVVAVPLSVVLEGARSRREIEFNGQELRLEHRVPLGDRPGAGWGWVELPADPNPADNVAFFAYTEAVTREALVVAEEGSRPARVLRLAAAPAPDRLRQACRVVSPEALGGVDWATLALVLWEAPPPAPGSAAAADLEAFVASGGVAAFFPPGAGGTGGSFGGLSWGSPEDAAGAGRNGGARPGAGELPTFRVIDWREEDGPLARTAGGQSLPVGALRVGRRQPVRGDGVSLATFEGGDPLLAARRLGSGTVYFCATRPAAGWSALSGGRVLVPLVQRWMEAGAARLANARLRSVGPAFPEPLDGPWRRLDRRPGGGISPASPAPAPLGDPRRVAGIYASGEQVVAANRPWSEDDWAVLDDAAVEAAFQGVPFHRFDAVAGGGQGGELASEVWRLFLFAVLVFLLAEAGLTFPPARPAAGASADAATGSGSSRPSAAA